MTQIISQSQNNNQESPFDRIRHFDESGQEFWMARELMKLFEYARWQMFKKAIEAAIENIEASGASRLQHFLLLEVKSKGRPALDYKLSRLAAYHVALCCDSRGKEKVKAAKHYLRLKREKLKLSFLKKEIA